MYYLIYRTTNLLNGKYYVGAHRTTKKNDDYLGSGVALKRAIKKYGRENFSKEIVEECETEDIMFKREAEIVDSILEDTDSYNMSRGGKGGFDHIDDTGDNNPMKSPRVADRNRHSVATTKAKNPEKYREIARENLVKASDANRGKKRPEHAERMRDIAREIWKRPGVKQKFKDTKNAWFEVTTPEGRVILTNRLTELCEEYIIPFNTMWTNTKSEKPISKGQAKGWKCKQIIQK